MDQTQQLPNTKFYLRMSANFDMANAKATERDKKSGKVTPLEMSKTLLTED